MDITTEVVQGTEFHDQIADTFFPQADVVFDDATALDTAIDMVEPQPTLVKCLVRHVLLLREILAANRDKLKGRGKVAHAHGRRQAPPIAGATKKRRLSAVACRRSIG